MEGTTPMWRMPILPHYQIRPPIVRLKGAMRNYYNIAFIRKTAVDALHDYHSNMQHMLVRRAWTHWNILHTDGIFSPLLKQHLRHAYRAYSPYTDTNAYVVGPWLPEKASFFRSKVIEGDQTTALSKPLTVRRPQTAVPCPGRRRATNIQARPKSAATRLTLSYPSPVPCSPYTTPPYKPGQCWN